jgi:hypothetical protein
MSSIHNGGIAVTIGGTSISTISSYSVSTHRGENITYTDISITTGVLSQADAQVLLAKGQNATAAVVCPDYNGTMYLTSVSMELASANIFGKYCRVTLSLTTEPPESENHITVNGISVELSSYDVSYAYERESFEMYDYSMYHINKGRRCSISYTTVPLAKAAADNLIAAFRQQVVTIGSGDYSGDMVVDSCSKSAVQQDGETKYTFTVSCTAIDVEGLAVST